MVGSRVIDSMHLICPSTYATQGQQIPTYKSFGIKAIGLPLIKCWKNFIRIFCHGVIRVPKTLLVTNFALDFRITNNFIMNIEN